jgi:hypothetical protein
MPWLEELHDAGFPRMEALPEALERSVPADGIAL